MTSLLLLVAATTLGGCIRTALGVGAGAGIAAAQERSIGDAWSDNRTGLAIRQRWSDRIGRPLPNVDITVTEGVVLLTGRLEDPDDRVDAVRIAWQTEGVRRVINEISLKESGGGIGGFADDVRIASAVRLKMMGRMDIFDINYTIDVVDGVVYLMGIARDEAELSLAVETARSVRGVDRVVSYVALPQEAISAADLGAAP